MKKYASFKTDLVKVQDELRRYAYKLTADYEEANDLVQEASMKALNNEDKYIPGTNFRGWMYTIVRNEFLNNFRKAIREQTYLNYTFNSSVGVSLESECIEGAYDLKEIHRVVNSLPQEYKTLFRMHVAGFRYREIADKLNLPLGTVKSRIFFARQRLQDELKDFV